MKKTKKGSKKGALRLVGTKMSPKIYKSIGRNARKFAEGNVSAWMRQAALLYRPKKNDRISFRAA